MAYVVNTTVNYNNDTERDLPQEKCHTIWEARDFVGNVIMSEREASSYIFTVCKSND